MTDLHTHNEADYKPGRPGRLGQVRHRYWLSLVLVVCGAAAFEFFTTAAANTNPPAPTQALTAAPAAPTMTRASFTVANGDTLAALFAARDLSATDLAAIMDLDQAAARLKRILPGDVIHVTYSPDAHIQSLHMQYDEDHYLDVTRQGTGYTAALTPIPTTIDTAYAHGVIENSLFDSAGRAGLSDATTMQLIQLFAWDIDFAHDIQNGDSFTVIYQKIRRSGHAVVDGPILAAEFKNSDKEYRVVRYTGPNGDTGYYTPDGRSVKKALMRAPVSYSRISSGFSLHRKHPILGFSRAHQGVDYAAPSGTPIQAAGDGRIAFEGYKGGYGKCMIIDHGGGYSTLYGHLSRFKPGTHTGMHVKQEQIIGYVGMTGLATGPHLLFEVRVNGVPHNPRTVKLPDTAPVQAADMAAFTTASANLLAQLSSSDDTRLAATAKAAAGAETAAH